MGRRRDDEEEEPSSGEEDDEQSSEGSESSSGEDSDASGSDEEEEEEDEENEEASKRAMVQKDVERMRTMFAEMDKIKMRLQFRLSAVQEAKVEAIQRECEQREERERRHAAAADFDAPGRTLTLPNDPAPPEPPAPPPVPVTPLRTDVSVQTVNEAVHVERASQVTIPAQERPTTPAQESLYGKDRALGAAQSSRSDGFISNPVSNELPSVKARSPGLSIYDLNESVGVEGTPLTSVTASAFCDKVMGMSRSKKLNPIPSESSNSEYSATPDESSYHSTAVRQPQASGGIRGSGSPRHQNRSIYSDPTSYTDSQPSMAEEPPRGSVSRNSRTTGTTFNGLDSLRPPLSPLAAASTDNEKTDEQRELEAIHVLLFNR